MRACMDMDDRADMEVLSLTLKKWCKKRLSDMRIDERRKVCSVSKNIMLSQKHGFI